MGAGNNQAVKHIFARSLNLCPLPDLYHTYIEFIRRVGAPLANGQHLFCVGEGFLSFGKGCRLGHRG